MKHLRLAGALLALVALLAPGLAIAQTTTGTILGEVKDSSGGAMPGVTVTAVNQANGLTRETVTDERGNYRFAAMPAGDYTVKATLTTEAGPVAFSFPPGLDHGFEIPPEARRFMSPEAQADLERELDQVREELREVERRLGELDGPEGIDPPAAPTPPAPPRVKDKGKAKGERAKKKR